MHKLIVDNYRQWIKYCKAVNVQHNLNSVRVDEYHLNGFSSWLELHQGFMYYQHMNKNL